MAFKIDHKNTGTDFSPLPAGEYEVFPTAFDYKISQSGNEMVIFNYKVRDDVDQEGKGREIRFDNFVDTEAAMWRVNAASKASGMEHGVEYDSIEEWASVFKGRAVRVVVKIEDYTDNKGNPRKKNTITGFKESEVGGSLAEEKAPDINDDDLPF